MKIYGVIEKSEKQSDGTMMVYGYASSESVDVDGEVIKADAIKKAIPDYMKFANVREMHKADTASGTVLEMEVQADGRTFVKTHIVDAGAVKKVETKVYKGFSIGGRVTERDADDKKIIKGIRLSEISLVDRPANPDSVFTFCKVDDGKTDDATKPEKPAEDATVKVADPEKKPELTAEGLKDANATTTAVSDKAAGATDDVQKKDEKVATSDEPVKKTDDVKKGMYSIQVLAGILSSIDSLKESAEWEAEWENDASTMPAEIKAWLNTGGELLKAMVTEEVAEMVKDDTVVVEVISLAERATTLVKAAWSAEDAGKFEKGLKALIDRRHDVLAKAGKRNSAVDQKHIDAIHAAAISLGATCDGADKTAGNSDDLKKAAGIIAVNDEIRKAIGAGEGDDVVAKVTALVAAKDEAVKVAEVFGQRVTELEALPKPGKAITRVVEKSADDGKPESGGDNDVKKSDDPKEALKKVWRGGKKIE